MQAYKRLETMTMADNEKTEPEARERRHGRLPAAANKGGRKSAQPPSREGRRLAAVFLTPEKLKEFKKAIADDDTSIQAYFEDVVDVYIGSKQRRNETLESQAIWKLAAAILTPEQFQALAKSLDAQGENFQEAFRSMVEGYIKD